MVTAAARGWGSGWPDCQRDACVWITAGGIRLLVRAEVAPIFKGFCDELVQRGYPLGNVADDWGFACRSIRGSDQPSNHSWGLAIDLNSTTNPMGPTLVTDFPAWAVDLGEKKYGLSWGGRYTSRPDAMHWEFLGTTAEASWLVGALAALPAEHQPPEPPAQEEADMHLIRRVEDGTIAFTGPGIFRPLNPEQAEVSAGVLGRGSLDVNARQYDVWRDLCLGVVDTADEADIARQVLAGLGDVALSDDQIHRIIDALPAAVVDEFTRRLTA